MSLKNLNTRKNRSDNQPTENVAIQVVEYHIAVKGKSNPDDDYLQGCLLHDALGLKAEFDENGSAKTMVKVKMRKSPQAQNSEYARPEILDLTRNNGNAKAVKPGGIVVFESCYLDRDGIVMARWPRAALHELESPKEFVYTAVYATVAPERETRNGERKYQQRFVAHVNEAVAFSGVEGFKEAATKALERDPAGGTSGFILRGADPEEMEFASTRWVRTGKMVSVDGEDVYQPNPAEDVLNEFMEKRADFIQVIDTMPNAIWEVIPITRYGTGPKSLPSAKKSKASDADNYTVRVEDHTESAYALSHVMLRRAGEEGNSWFGTTAMPTSRAPALFLDSELPTPNLPEALLNHAYSNAIARKTVRAESANAQSQDQEGDPHFGDPDPMAEAQGMNP